PARGLSRRPSARVTAGPPCTKARLSPSSHRQPTGERPAMPDAQEQMEHAEHAEHASHSNKGIALLIAVLALILAISEMAGKSAQTSALTLQIESSALWNFFQAKTIRRTVTIVATDSAKIEQTL